MDYETIVKKLINVFKSQSTTSVDQLNEIELLWDSINNSSNTVEHTNGHTVSTSKQASIKRATSDLQQLNTNFHKRQKLHTSVSSTSISKSKQETVSTASSSSSANNSKASKSIHEMPDEDLMAYDYFKATETNSSNDDNSNNTNNSSTNNNNNNNTMNSMYIMHDDDHNNDEDLTTSNIDEYVIEMGLTCDTCKLIIQEPNNKLAECQECKRLYHQQCHRPVITNDEIQDPRMLWFCSKCKKSVQKFTNKTSKQEKNIMHPSQLASSKEQAYVDATNQSTSTTINNKSGKALENEIESQNPNGCVTPLEQQKPFFKRDPRLNETPLTSASHQQTIQSVQSVQLNSSNNQAPCNVQTNSADQNRQPFKGLAALATRFNTNFTQNQQTSSASIDANVNKLKTNISQAKIVNDSNHNNSVSITKGATSIGKKSQTFNNSTMKNSSSSQHHNFTKSLPKPQK